MSYSKEEISQYRTKRAKESYEEAKLMAESNHWNSTANRLYYACFYMTSAYLAINGFEASTHNGIKSGFNRKLIKEGKIDKEYGQLYNKLFNLRQDADYRDFKDVSEAQVKPLISKTEKLIEELENLMKNDGN